VKPGRSLRDLRNGGCAQTVREQTIRLGSRRAFGAHHGEARTPGAARWPRGLTDGLNACKDVIEGG